MAIGGGISAQPVLLEQIKWASAKVKKVNPLQRANPSEGFTSPSLISFIYSLMLSSKHSFSNVKSVSV